MTCIEAITERAPMVHIMPLTPLGGAGSVALAVNAAGWVVGQAETVTGEHHACLWRDGKAIDLGTLGGTHSYAAAINDAGEIVGYSLDTGGQEQAIRWAEGVMIGLGSLPGGTSSTAFALNTRGQIVGWSLDVEGRLRPVRWESGTVVDLGTLDGEEGDAQGINDAGWIVGWIARDIGDDAVRSAAMTPPPGHAVLWREGTITDLGTLGGARSCAWAINETGQVVGEAETAAGQRRAFRWERGTMLDLGSLGGEESSVTALAEDGRVVGTAQTVSGAWHACLWEHGRIVDLNDRLPRSSDWVLTAANGINRRGQIVGVGQHAGTRRGYLLTPVGDGAPP